MDELKRMILNRVETDAVGVDDAAQQIREAPDIELLRQNSPTSLLIEGAADAISGLVGGLKGWQALPTVSYARPDVRPQVLKTPG
jgi:hypothetical protein